MPGALPWSAIGGRPCCDVVPARDVSDTRYDSSVSQVAERSNYGTSYEARSCVTDLDSDGVKITDSEIQKCESPVNVNDMLVGLVAADGGAVGGAVRVSCLTISLVNLIMSRLMNRCP